jgi:hypothetical protein
MQCYTVPLLLFLADLEDRDPQKKQGEVFRLRPVFLLGKDQATAAAGFCLRVSFSLIRADFPERSRS